LIIYPIKKWKRKKKVSSKLDSICKIKSNYNRELGLLINSLSQNSTIFLEGANVTKTR
jgi:hypothetical protein